MARVNYFRVKEGQDKTFMTGNEVSLLQQSGCHVKILRKATKDEYDNGHADTRPDWESNCVVCGSTPVLPITGMCGPCTFGEAETINGNW